MEFFRRTYLTESLKRLLAGAFERLSGTGGDPVEAEQGPRGQGFGPVGAKSVGAAAAASSGAGAPVDATGLKPGSAPAPQRRFHRSAALDPLRVGADAGRIAQKVIAHLAALPGAEVRVALEIEVQVPLGVPDGVQRIVTENCRALKFTSHGFERQ